MKLTKTQLRQIIKEEFENFNEAEAEEEVEVERREISPAALFGMKRQVAKGIAALREALGIPEGESLQTVVQSLSAVETDKPDALELRDTFIALFSAADAVEASFEKTKYDY